MKRRFRCPVATKMEFVAEVLSGYRIEVVARQHGFSPKTLSTWVRQYQDEVDDILRPVLRICEVASSTYYYHIQHPERMQPICKGRPVPGFSYDMNGKAVLDARIKGYIRRLIQGPDAAFGYRKLTVLLRRRYKLIINKKKVYRICKELKILAPSVR